MKMSVLHTVLMIIVQFKLSTTFYYEFVYHNGNILTGFFLLSNGPFIISYFLYGVSYFSAYRRNSQMLMVFIVCQTCIVGILIIIGTTSVYLNFKYGNNLEPYNFVLGAVRIKTKLYEITALVAVSIGSILLFVLELYWLVFAIQFYNEIKKNSATTVKKPG